MVLVFFCVLKLYLLLWIHWVEWTELGVNSIYHLQYHVPMISYKHLMMSSEEYELFYEPE